MGTYIRSNVYSSFRSSNRKGGFSSVKLRFEQLEERRLLSISHCYDLQAVDERNAFKDVAEPSVQFEACESVGIEDGRPNAFSYEDDYLDFLSSLEVEQILATSSAWECASEAILDENDDEQVVELIAHELVFEDNETSQDDSEINENIVLRSGGGNLNPEDYHITVISESHSSENGMAEVKGVVSPDNFSDFSTSTHDYYLLNFPELPYGYEADVRVSNGTAVFGHDYIALKNVGGVLTKLTTMSYSGGSNNQFYIVPVNDSYFESPEEIKLELLAVISGSGGNNVEPQVLDDFRVLIIDDEPAVTVSWKESQTAGAEISTSPHTGLRFYPEQENIRENSLKNSVDVVFELSEPFNEPKTIFYKIVDPSNYAHGWLANPSEGTYSSNDNHSNSWYMVSRKIGQSAPESISPAVVHLADGTVYSLSLPANVTTAAITLKLLNAYAGDNFIVIADLNASNVSDAHLGVTLSTRYSVERTVLNQSLGQSPLLTVWRSLWVEKDQMEAPVAPTAENPESCGFTWDSRYEYDPAAVGAWSETAYSSESPDFDLLCRPAELDVSLAEQQLTRACVTLKVISDEQLSEWLGENNYTNSPSFSRELDCYSPNTSSTGRDLSLQYNKPSFWLVHALSAYNPCVPNATGYGNGDVYYYDNNNDSFYTNWLWGYASGSTLIVYDECLRDCIATGPSCKISVDLTEARRRAFYHEILHYFLGGHSDNPQDFTNYEIMNYDKIFRHDLDPKLSLQQIEVLQSRATCLQNGYTM